MNNNALKTTILLASIGGLFVALGGLVGRGTGVMIGALLGFAIAGGSYWFSHKLALRSAQARPLEDGELPWLREMVQDLATRSNIPMPALYISPSPQPNAFATGRNPKHAAVAVTEGILGTLSQEELRGVLAHELAHVKNRDILISSVAAAFGMAISAIADFLSFSTIFGGNDEESPNPVAAIAIALTAPLVAGLMQMALSRSREFAADESGAKLLGSGDSLSLALRKIDAAAHRVPMDVPEAQAQAYIINPLAGFSARKLFSTHPPTEERVARLSQMRFDGNAHRSVDVRENEQRPTSV